MRKTWCSSCAASSRLRPEVALAIAGVDLRLQIGLFCEKIVHLLIAHRLGEFIGDFVEPVERGFDPGEGAFDVLPHGLVWVELRLLRQVADPHALGSPGLTTVVRFNPSHDLQQGGFAGPVDAEDADFNAGQKGEGNSFEDLRPPGKDFVRFFMT